MKWIKRLLFAALVGGVALLLFGAAAFWSLHSAPRWYRNGDRSPDELGQAADRAELMINRTLAWASDLHLSRQAYTARTDPPRMETFQIHFTGEELNGFLVKWAGYAGRQGRWDSYVSEPRVALRDGRLILAAGVKQLGIIISAQISAGIDEQGLLRLQIEKVSGGVLPLPRSIWSTQRDRLIRALRNSLPAMQRRANFAFDGTANPDAANAAMDRLLIQMLDNQVSQPIIFLPCDIGRSDRLLPVRINKIELTDDMLTMEVQDLTPPQRQALAQESSQP